VVACVTKFWVAVASSAPGPGSIIGTSLAKRICPPNIQTNNPLSPEL
jgi:hypothetical protein